VPGVLASVMGSDWSAAGSLLTFYFPAVLFIVVAGCLYLTFTRPHAVPGRKPLPARGVVSGEQPAAAADHDPEASDTDP
jgi:hypothetical protein